jgi:alkylation response protein AidB-like acyl-CoA dehydrogenase
MYRSPVDEISFTLKQVAGLKKSLDEGQFEDLSDDLVDAILEEAGKFASEEVAPLNTFGDEHGTPFKDGVVTLPQEMVDLYTKWREGGWNSLMGDPEYGGQGLPVSLAAATFEMWNSSSMGFGVGPLLTIGAVEALEAHASDKLKDIYLEKMVTGEWMGTMNLTEPQAGSDLNAVKTKAEPNGDGTYRIYGQKIFITYGEHNLTENIVHLVLARLPGAPEGYKGISLFLVPKFLVNEDGSLGARNDAFCNGVEHKLGIHASPTCTMIYGDGYQGAEKGAIGWLVGEENRGLACMFTMMNNARLMVGIQGVAVAEAATQKAIQYANERLQGTSLEGERGKMSPIVEHPDVQRNLLTMKALTQASRGICYSCAHALDMAKTEDGKFWNERANLLTPIAKAFSTDVGVDVASLGVQVHGGMGFIEETGAAQYLRDARIGPIYEGTNGIQAMDLVARKLPLSDGECFATYLKELREIADEVKASNRPEFGDTADELNNALDDLEEAGNWMLEQFKAGQMELVLSGATPFLRLAGLAAGNSYLAKAALSADDANRAGLARFMAENLLGETKHLKRVAIEGAASLAALKTTLKA